VGYDDPSYFARLFRRSTGVSPAGYRRRIHVEGAVPVSA
jgi:AraC-like DNA-binding protein